MAIKSQEVSFITSFPSQLPIYRWKREMAKGFLLQGDPFAPPQSPTSAQMVVRKHRKVWRTDKSFQCYRSKIICNKICQAPEIHSVSWGVCDMRVLISQLTVVRLHRNGTVLCSGMSPKQKARQHWHHAAWIHISLDEQSIQRHNNFCFVSLLSLATVNSARFEVGPAPLSI